MRTAVDYFGLMAYLWVMSGGMPEADVLTPAQQTPARVSSRGRRQLRVIEGRKPESVGGSRKTVASDATAAA